jgi:hypothetical protein
MKRERAEHLVADGRAKWVGGDLKLLEARATDVGYDGIENGFHWCPSRSEGHTVMMAQRGRLVAKVAR